jgi:hypothetical protein
LTVEAIYVGDASRKQLLKRMSLIVERERVMLRLAMDLKYISFQQFEFASKAFNEIGRMIGGWLKSSS